MAIKSSKSRPYTGKVTFPLSPDEVTGLHGSLAWACRALGAAVTLLLERQHSDSKHLIESPIDFSLLPDAPDLSAELVNSIRP